MTKHFIYERLCERHLGLIRKPRQSVCANVVIWKKKIQTSLEMNQGLNDFDATLTCYHMNSVSVIPTLHPVRLFLHYVNFGLTGSGADVEPELGEIKG